MIHLQTELLAGLDERDANDVRAVGMPMRLAAGETLFRLGGDADRLFLIDRGRIALTLPMQVIDREEEILVEERRAGQTVGWSALIPPHRFTLEAKAIVESEVLALPREALTARFAINPHVGCLVMRNLSAVIGQRLHVIEAMWLREMQRVVQLTHA
jgi:CRP-like cAMP-binding protein